MYNLTQKILGGERIYGVLQDIVKKTIEGIQYRTVLDVGCGTGSFRGCFNGDYTGIDLNSAYIKVAKITNRGKFLVGDATRLPFSDEEFDLVFTLGVLHHLDTEQCEKMLKEMLRVCKKDGHILIIDGIIPTNKLNLLGYILARLDRGRYKLVYERFKNMITKVYNKDMVVDFKNAKAFPHEYALMLLQCHSQDVFYPELKKPYTTS